MKESADRNDDHVAPQVDEPMVVSEEIIDLTDPIAPMRHFHRPKKARELSTRSLANPRRTRLV